MPEAAPPAAFGVARSFSGRRWQFKPVDDEAAQALTRAQQISPTLARLLAARGIGEADVWNYLNPSLKHLLPDPRVLKDMDKAVARVALAIGGGALSAGEKIAVFGDYDVDGSASSALLADFLGVFGNAPRIYIPDRMTEGYGPSPAAMKTLAGEGNKLVITVDCGAAATAALEEAKAQGMDVVVLDHHRVDHAPPACAHVNPNQPGDESGLGHLCAAGVCFLFLVALNRYLRDSGFYETRGIPEPDLRLALDLVGLATVCDVVPLTGLNRAFVRQGLARLGSKDGARPGLKALAEIAKATAPYTPYTFGFLLGPRINAGGRVGRSSLGADLLTARDPEAASDFALQLDLHNRERQGIERGIVEEALAAAATQANAPFILVTGDGWHPGVVGIVAGRLKERFGKPCFVAGFEGGMGRGSARSIPGIDVGGAIRAAVFAGVIESGGGHAMAAGFSLDTSQLRGLQAFLETAFEGKSDALATGATLDLDAAASPAGAGQPLLEEIALAGPYGAGNAEPLLAFPDLRVSFADVVGKDHIRLRLNGGGAALQAIAFRAVGTKLGDGLLASRGQAIHAAGRLKRDDWKGQVRIQLEIEDAAPAGA